MARKGRGKNEKANIEKLHQRILKCVQDDKEIKKNLKQLVNNEAPVIDRHVLMAFGATAPVVGSFLWDASLVNQANMTSPQGSLLDIIHNTFVSRYSALLLVAAGVGSYIFHQERKRFLQSWDHYRNVTDTVRNLVEKELTSFQGKLSKDDLNKLDHLVKAATVAKLRDYLDARTALPEEEQMEIINPLREAHLESWQLLQSKFDEMTTQTAAATAHQTAKTGHAVLAQGYANVAADTAARHGGGSNSRNGRARR
jgi:hypothetical protein